MADTPGRLLRLLSMLQARPSWNGPELGEALGVSTRTIRKDIERLRELGYPVDATPGAAGGYRLGSGVTMPPLILDDEEAVAVAVGLRTAASTSLAGIEETALRALTKLETVLPSRLRRRIHALQTQIEPLRWSTPEATVDPEALAVLSQACRDGEQIRFAYQDREGTESRRLVEPYRLVTAGHRWYLVAWDVRRGDWRTFRIDRSARPTLAGVRFRHRPLPAADAASFVRQGITAARPQWDASVRLLGSRDDVARRVPRHAVELEAIDASSCRLRTTTGDLDWLALRLALLGWDFEVESPPELAERVRLAAGRLARAAGEPG